jgi:[ribosomal protein S5]-alanine N-acetyltransferase
MRIALPGCVIRGWLSSDRSSVARLANNPKVSANLRDAFPSPYTPEDADRFIAVASTRTPQTLFAIEVDGEAAGSIGLKLNEDVERISAELGYWLGEPYWGRGVMTRVVRAFSDWAFPAFSLHRIYALPYANNPASARVLEKAGFQCEGRLRRAAIKHGQVLDQLLYADVR